MAGSQRGRPIQKGSRQTDSLPVDALLHILERCRSTADDVGHERQAVKSRAWGGASWLEVSLVAIS